MSLRAVIVRVSTSKAAGDGESGERLATFASGLGAAIADALPHAIELLQGGHGGH